MEQLINKSNSQKVIALFKTEFLYRTFVAKTDSQYERNTKSLRRKHERNQISHIEYSNEMTALEQWYKEKKESPLYTAKGVFSDCGTTALHIIYNQIRRGDRRPHTGSVESDAAQLRQFTTKKVITYIKEKFPMTEVDVNESEVSA